MPQGVRRPARTLRLWTGAFVLFIVSLVARLPFCTGSIFTYDAADYLRAARTGLWSQYLGLHSISFVAFLNRFLNDPDYRRHPWGPLYLSHDVAALRHFHVPFAFYLPALQVDLGFGFRSQLISIAVISSLTVAVVYLILLSFRVSSLLATIVGLFLSFSPTLILAGITLSPHAMFTLVSTLTVFACCKWIQQPSRLWAALTILACSVSMATMELAPVLVATLLAVLGMNWSWSGRDFTALTLQTRQLAWAAAAIALLLFVIWPGGFVRGGYLLSYGTFVDQGLLKHQLYFKNPGLIPGLIRLGHGRVLGFTAALGLLIAIYANFRVRKNIPLFAFTVFAVLLFAQGIGNGFRNPTYASHPAFAIAIAAALAIQSLWSAGARVERWFAAALAGGLACLTLAEAGGFLSASPQEVTHDPERVYAAIADLRKSYPPGTAFVVTQDYSAFILNAPEYAFVGSVTTGSSQPQPWIPFSRYYLLVDLEDPDQPHDVPLCDNNGLSHAGFAISCQEIARPARD